MDERSAGRATGPRLPRARHLSQWRARLADKPGIDLTYRIVVGVIGSVVLAAGIVLIPYPGPGWLFVFAGLAILGSEFVWAHRLLHAGRRRYDAWTAWMRRQSPVVRLLLVALTGVVVLVSLWLFNAFGQVAELIGLDWSWLEGPIG